MTDPIEVFAAGASTLLGGFAGSKVGLAVAAALAEVAPPMPEWMQYLLGPFGALVGVLIALRWMTSRLAEAQTAAAEREKAALKREEDMREENKEDRKEAWDAITALQRETNTTTQAAVTVMNEVKNIISKCGGKG